MTATDQALLLSATDWIALSAAAIALVATIGAFAQALAAAAGNRAHFYVTFSERYTSEKMRKALELLAKWHCDHPDTQTRYGQWVADKRSGQEDAVSLNKARRLVSRYFYDVAALRELGLINVHFARALISNNGLNVFYHVCHGMNCANQPQRRIERHYEVLRKLCKKFGDGRVYCPDELHVPESPPSWRLRILRWLRLAPRST